ncbi:MAG: archaeal proteasome endopeptidase complex subunit alpha [Methanobacteriota archaeon]
MEPSEQHYDEASTIFSPDGRLFQVEYAREVIEKGSPSIGIKYNDGVLLLVYKELNTHLAEIHQVDKIYQIDDHIGCAASGLVADARHLVDIAQDESQMNRLLYNEQIPVKTLVESLCDYKHVFTQFDGVRPFGVALIVAGVDSTGNHLYVTDPSGALVEYKAVCEGEGSQKVMVFLKTNYTANLSLNAAVTLGVEALQKTGKKKINTDMLELAVIDNKQKFHRFSAKEFKRFLK